MLGLDGLCLACNLQCFNNNASMAGNHKQLQIRESLGRFLLGVVRVVAHDEHFCLNTTHTDATGL